MFLPMFLISITSLNIKIDMYGEYRVTVLNLYWTWEFSKIVFLISWFPEPENRVTALNRMPDGKKIIEIRQNRYFFTAKNDC